MYHSSFLSAATMIFPSADPFSSRTFATVSITSRAVFARGKARSTNDASGRPSFTSGSSFNTLSFGVAETVAVIATPSSLKPCAAKFPLLPLSRSES